MIVAAPTRRLLAPLLAVLLLGAASWLVLGAWWAPRNATGPGAQRAADEGEAPTLVGIAPRPGGMVGEEPQVVDVDGLVRDLQAVPVEEQWVVLARLRGPIAHDERLERLLLSRLGGRREGRYAFRALAGMQPPPVAATLPLLYDASWRVRINALSLLATWRARGHDVPRQVFFDLLEDPDDEVRRRAVGPASSDPAYDPGIARWLLERIRPGDRGPEWGPARLLARMGPQGLAHLLPLLDSGDAGLRLQALTGLRAADPAEIRRQLPRIGELIHDRDEDVQEAALQALLPLEGDCEACLPEISAALEDESVLVVRAALGVVEQMGARAAKAVPAIINLLDDQDDRIARQAAGVLGEMQSKPEWVLPALTEGLYGDHRDSAALALARFGQAALPYALEAFGSGDDGARYAALLTLRELGPAAGAIAPHLPALIRGDDVETAQRAMDVAGRIGADAVVALPAILERLWEADILAPDRGAAEILMALGPRAREALRRGLRDKDAGRRETALRVVRRCYGRSAFALPELEPLLSAPEVLTRRLAVAAVCAAVLDDYADLDPRSGPELRARVRVLLEPVRRDEDERARYWADDLCEQLDALESGGDR